MRRNDLSHSFIGWFALLFNLYFDLLVCCTLFLFFPWGERGGGEGSQTMTWAVGTGLGANRATSLLTSMSYVCFYTYRSKFL